MVDSASPCRYFTIQQMNDRDERHISLDIMVTEIKL
jgi:hypothetical protein